MAGRAINPRAGLREFRGIDIFKCGTVPFNWIFVQLEFGDPGAMLALLPWSLLPPGHRGKMVQ
jgi:hypothetical protein